MSSQGESCDIFGSLLTTVHYPAANRSCDQIIPTWPIKINDDFKVMQDGDLINLFVINGEIIIVKKSVKSIKVQKINIMQAKFECHAMLEIFDVARSVPIKDQYNLLDTSSMNIISQKCNNPSSMQGILEIKRDLFCSIFSLKNVLEKSWMFMCSDENGKVFSFPVTMGMKGDRIDSFDGKNVLCDLKQPLLNMLVAEVKDFSLKDDETGHKRHKNAPEEHLTTLKETLKGDDVLMLVGKLGKVVIILRQIKGCQMSVFNMCHVPGPVLSVSSTKDLLISVTGESLHISKLFICLHIENGQQVSISPILKPVYTMNISVSCIPRTILSSATAGDCNINFNCANREGHILDIMLDHVAESDASLKSTEPSEINYLIKTLESSQKDLNKLKSLLMGQDCRLQYLEMAASLTATIMNNLKSDENQSCLKVSKSNLFCNIDCLSMDADGTLYLDITIHNDSEYNLPEDCLVQCVGEARQRTMNSSFGELTAFSKVFPLRSMKASSFMRYKYHVSFSEMQIFLPVRFDFNLSIKFPQPSTTNATVGAESLIPDVTLPLNSHTITILDILNIQDGQVQQDGPYLSNANYQLHQTCLLCSAFEFVPNKDVPTEPKSLTIPPFFCQCLFHDGEPSNSTNAIETLLSKLFPYNDQKTFANYGTTFLLELPCKHQATMSLVIEKVTKKDGVTDVPSILLECHNVHLLLALHSAILHRFEVSK